jgi:DNA mismatch repair protein MutS2
LRYNPHMQKKRKNVFHTSNPGISPELDLHAMTIDEAMPLVQDYLDQAFRAGIKEVRIVHGKGTGVLRQAVMRELKKHPLVKSFRTGDRYEGSTGATVVQL